jgi:hypothetical protein
MTENLPHNDRVGYDLDMNQTLSEETIVMVEATQYDGEPCNVEALQQQVNLQNRKRKPHMLRRSPAFGPHAEMFSYAKSTYSSERRRNSVRRWPAWYSSISNPCAIFSSSHAYHRTIAAPSRRYARSNPAISVSFFRAFCSSTYAGATVYRNDVRLRGTVYGVSAEMRTCAEWVSERERGYEI